MENWRKIAPLIIPFAVALAIIMGMAIIFKVSPPCGGKYRFEIGGDRYLLYNCEHVARIIVPAKRDLKISEGDFKFNDRPHIYYSDGKGNYCVYKSMDDYTSLTGNRGWSELTGKLSEYVMKFDGTCTGAASIPSAHPDPN